MCIPQKASTWTELTTLMLPSSIVPRKVAIKKWLIAKEPHLLGYVFHKSWWSASSFVEVDNWGGFIRDNKIIFSKIYHLSQYPGYFSVSYTKVSVVDVKKRNTMCEAIFKTEVFQILGWKFSLYTFFFPDQCFTTPFPNVIHPTLNSSSTPTAHLTKVWLLLYMSGTSLTWLPHAVPHFLSWHPIIPCL